MKKSEKIKELVNELFVLNKRIEYAKNNNKYLSEYFQWVLAEKVIRAQIQALNWTFDDEDHPKICPCCGSDKVYLTSAIHCNRCAVTTEI